MLLAVEKEPILIQACPLGETYEHRILTIRRRQYKVEGCSGCMRWDSLRRVIEERIGYHILWSRLIESEAANWPFSYEWVKAAIYSVKPIYETDFGHRYYVVRDLYDAIYSAIGKRATCRICGCKENSDWRYRSTVWNTSFPNVPICSYACDAAWTRELSIQKRRITRNRNQLAAISRFVEAQ